MLENAVAAFIDGLPTERSFDLPLMALLRAMGFYDVHLLHGTFEQGKDFVAKRDDEGRTIQYAIQSKLGDINKFDWRNTVNGQLEDMANSLHGHPNYDAHLVRRNILVLTGRLTGLAKDLVDQYKEGLPGRNLPALEVWDRESLVEKLTAGTCLAESQEWTIPGQFIQNCVDGKAELPDIEAYTRRWLQAKTCSELWKYMLEACIVRDKLQRQGLSLLTPYLAYGITRAAEWLLYGQVLTPEEATEIQKATGRELCAQQEYMLDAFNAFPENERERFLIGGSPLDVIFVSCRCLLLMEHACVALMADRWRKPEYREKVIELLRHLLRVKASARPISDEYAVSVLLAAVVSARCGIDVTDWLKQTAVWVCEAYEKGRGLASPRSAAFDQLTQLLARWADLPSKKKNGESALGASILDACSLLQIQKLYDDVHNDLLAVGARPVVSVPVQPPDEFILGASGIQIAFEGNYAEVWQGTEGWQNSKLHAATAFPRKFDDRSLYWVGASLSALMRDRYWLYSLVQWQQSLTGAQNSAA